MEKKYYGQHNSLSTRTIGDVYLYTWCTKPLVFASCGPCFIYVPYIQLQESHIFVAKWQVNILERIVQQHCFDVKVIIIHPHLKAIAAIDMTVNDFTIDANVLIKSMTSHYL